MIHPSELDVHTFICSNKLLDKFLYKMKDYFYYTTEICMGLVAVELEWLKLAFIVLVVVVVVVVVVVLLDIQGVAILVDKIDGVFVTLLVVEWDGVCVDL